MDSWNKKINELAIAYTPEWKFDTSNPDMGSVIAMIFSNQLKENARHHSLLQNNYQVELANMAGISLKPAYPAQAIVVMECIDKMKGGGRIKAGTKLLGETDEGEVIFETRQENYISSVHLSDILQISGKHGKILTSYERETKESDKFTPVALFSYADNSEEQEELIIEHNDLFHKSAHKIDIIFSGNMSSNELAEIFTDTTKFDFYMKNENEERAISAYIKDEKIVSLQNINSDLEESDLKEFSIILRKKEKVNKTIELYNIEMLGDEGDGIPELVYDGMTELLQEEFLPFGREIAEYKECYIGHEAAFSKKGAQVTISFELDFIKNELGFAAVPKEELKYIKRKPKYMRDENAAKVYASEIILEYFNGTGWRKLETKDRYETIFNETSSGAYTMVFDVPHNWENIGIGGYEQRLLRIKIIRADHCYIRPAIHYCPIMKNMKISYDYKERILYPTRVYQKSKYKQEDITLKIKQKESVIVFSQIPYNKNYIYFGFKDLFEEGPISLFLEFKKNQKEKGLKLIFEYSSVNGFKQFKVIDHTNGFLNSGIVRFDPPYEMKKVMVEGKKRYWIRVTDEEGIFDDLKTCSPVLTGFHTNGVEVHNVETRKMQEYFMDQVSSGMEFPLYARNILDADVWVNEKEELSLTQMKHFIETNPGDVEVIYNFLGEIEEFYIRWREVEHFNTCKEGSRVYVIDRINNQLIFGDGVHVRIPRNISTVAFKASVRCCEGSRGNVAKEKISLFSGNVSFIDKVYNTFSAYGGSNIETLHYALKRSSNLLSTRKRLVSETDFINECMAFSDNVIQVKCMVGKQKKGGESGEVISLVVLTRDYKKDALSFDFFKKQLKEHLLSRCEADLYEEDLEIVSPVFAYVTLNVWLAADKSKDTFRIQNIWKKKITEFLEPVKDKGQNRSIGNFPKEHQIQMMLKSLEKEAVIKRYSVTVSYSDDTGIHETSLREIGKNPFAICCNGEHQIYITKEVEE